MKLYLFFNTNVMYYEDLIMYSVDKTDEGISSDRIRSIFSLLILNNSICKLKDQCDLPIVVPHFGYADRIQEVHTMIIHIMIRGIEETLAK